MNFFIPEAKDSIEAESVYGSIRSFITSQSSYKLDNRRIYSITFRHDGKIYKATVGEVFSRINETVIAILHAEQLYYICTPNRGVVRGEPVYVGHNEIIEVTDFEI